MENRALARNFAGLSTPLIADAALRLQLSILIAPPGIQPVIPGKRLAGRALPAKHFGSVDVFLEAMESASPGDVLVITDADNGKTVTVAAASRVSVQLSSTYWTFDPVSNPAVLAAEGPQQTSPCAAKTFPGSGCGIAAVTYAATASGTAVVTAHRSTCGEAMLCTPSQSGFRVTVVVG